MRQDPRLAVHSVKVGGLPEEGFVLAVWIPSHCEERESEPTAKRSKDEQWSGRVSSQ